MMVIKFKHNKIKKEGCPRQNIKEMTIVTIDTRLIIHFTQGQGSMDEENKQKKMELTDKKTELKYFPNKKTSLD